MLYFSSDCVSVVILCYPTFDLPDAYRALNPGGLRSHWQRARPVLNMAFLSVQAV